MRRTVFTPVVVGCVCAVALAAGTMIASSAAHAVTTFRTNLSACIVFLLLVGKIRTRLEVVLSESVRIELILTNHDSCGILTFAILLPLRLVFSEGKPLGENHQMLAIPAGYVKGAGKQKARQAGHVIPRAKSY